MWYECVGCVGACVCVCVVFVCGDGGDDDDDDEDDDDDNEEVVGSSSSAVSFNNLRKSHNIIQVINSKWMRRARHLALVVNCKIMVS